MYFPYFITYIGIGFAVSLGVFWWALKNGQFKDQQRARFLPLEADQDSGPHKITAFGRFEAVTLVLLAVTGLSASAAVLIFALFFGNRP